MKEPLKNLFIFLLLALLSCNQSNEQKDTTTLSHKDPLATTSDQTMVDLPGPDLDNLPDELKEFVPANYSALYAAPGDLNLDGTNDYILVLKRNGEDSLSKVADTLEKRPLLVLLRDQNNKLSLVKRNDNSVYCVNCGGMMGDPFVGIRTGKGYFSVEHYGGSAWRWTRILTFKYSQNDNEWYLHEDSSDSFHALEPDKVKSSVRTNKDFGQLKFEDFDIYKVEHHNEVTHTARPPLAQAARRSIS